MADKISFDEYVNRSNLKFNNNFDFSEFKDFKNGHSKLVIRCIKHDHKFELDIFHHIGNTYGGCDKCLSEAKSKNMKIKMQTMKKKPIVVDHDKVLSKLLEKYQSDNYEYDLTNLVLSTVGDILCYCKIHNYLTNRLMRYLLNPNITNWCPHCAHILRVKNKLKSYDNVIKELSKIHNNFYFYPELNSDNYKNLNLKIKIVCPEHGEFIKSAKKHYIQGCYRCKINELIKNRILIGAYSQKYFDKNPDFMNLPGYIYYVRIGKRYKIGITKNLKNRLRGLRHLFNQEIILIDSIKCTIYDAWKTEDYILKTYKDARLFTKQLTELFLYDILNSKIEIYKHTPTK